MSADEKVRHTPGPWQRGGGYGPRSTAVTTVSGRHVAAVETWGLKHVDERAKRDDLHEWWPEGEANLKLIAAAPDLLAALKSARAAWLSEANQGDGIDEANAPVLAAVDAVIAKAEGR